MKVVVVGGGVAGFSSAMVAKKVGAEVTLIERTDMLGGLGMVAGIGLLGFWNVAVTQEKALGGADLVDVFESIATHRGISPPGYENVLLYNVTRLDSALQKVLTKNNIEFMLSTKVTDTEMSGNSVKAVMLADGTKINGDAFVDATGAVGGIATCDKFGYGCVECIYRCPTFGNPGGIADKKAKTFNRNGSDGKPGVIGTSVMIPIASLSAELQQEVNSKGYIAISVPPGVEPDLVRYGRAGASVSALMDQDITKLNILLLNIGGFVKVTATGSPLFARSLRRFPGLEDATIMQPTAGARGHLVHGTGIALRDNSLKADGFDNLFCAGAKAGPAMCLMDSMVTADLAGYNAVRQGLGQSCLELPKTLVTGAYIDHVGQALKAGEQVKREYRSVIQMELLKGLCVYREGDEIVKEVDKAGLRGIYKTRLC